MWTPLFALLISLLPLQAAQNRPPAFPREGAKQIIDNERVTVWDVTLEKGKPTPMHEHPFDIVTVDLADAAVKTTKATGAVSSSVVKKGTAGFSRKGLTHSDEGTSDVPRHVIVIELKDVVVPPIPNNSGYPEAFPREGSKKLIDNERVTVWDYSWAPGKATATHFHSRDVVVVYLDNGDLTSTTPDGKATLSSHTFGETRFNARNRVHSELLVKGKQRVIAVELK